MAQADCRAENESVIIIKKKTAKLILHLDLILGGNGWI